MSCKRRELALEWVGEMRDRSVGSQGGAGDMRRADIGEKEGLRRSGKAERLRGNGIKVG